MFDELDDNSAGNENQGKKNLVICARAPRDGLAMVFGQVDGQEQQTHRPKKLSTVPSHFPNIPNNFLYILIGFIYKSIHFNELSVHFLILALFCFYFDPHYFEGALLVDLSRNGISKLIWSSCKCCHDQVARGLS